MATDATKWSGSATPSSFDGGDTETSKSKRVNDEYFDVLLLGKTGMGKSRTGNKLINSNSANPVIGRWDIKGGNKCLIDDSEQPKGFKEESKESTTTTTRTCELLSDESGTPKLRVLDVEGFAPTNRQKNISILEEVERALYAHKLKFSRIVYFLPVRGRLQKADYNIFEELDLLKVFFGKSIFDSMIIICTEDPLDDVIKWPPPKMKHTKEAFLGVLRDVIGQPEYPDPPIVFLPHSATPDEVRKLIKNSNVKCESFELQYTYIECHRCGLQFTRRTLDEKMFGVTCITDKGIVSYSETKCHPLLVTKYTRVEQFAANLIHILTFGVTLRHKKSLGMPGFGLLRSCEWCPHCQKKPHTPGCLPVNEVYEYTYRWSKKCSILVHHSDSTA